MCTGVAVRAKLRLRGGGGGALKGKEVGGLPAGLSFRGFDKRLHQPACPSLLLSLGLET